MNESRTHRAVSEDGTEIVARVYGHGAPLILLPAGPGDSMTSWRPLLPILQSQFTCYLVDTRGRGLSAENPDHSPTRLAQDVTAYVESLGEPAGLLAWGSALWTLVAARAPRMVSAVAAYEPGVDEVMGQDTAAGLGETIIRMGNLVAAGRLVEGARVLIDNQDIIYTDEDMVGEAAAHFWETSAPNLPVFLKELQQAAESGEPSPTSSAVLGNIRQPVLLLHGARSRPWFRESVRYVSHHVANAEACEIDGAGHFGPHTAPEAVAAEITRFFSRRLPGEPPSQPSAHRTVSSGSPLDQSERG